ncbi:hypothetical protein [Hydrogenophaga sp. 5NK40-0174]|uniref:hypothetical protein n=1 Tax=Hydrogenophaga sp. 5NK40-0174 TaxID=3127649 RepID=UPI0031084097
MGQGDKPWWAGLGGQWRGVTLALVAATAGLWVMPAYAAFEFEGRKTVYAVAADGTRTPVAALHFEKTGQAGQATFKLDLEVEKFTDFFLSMREFKCLPNDKEITCYVPYPYEQPGTVRADDLRWLEHSLLFFYKTPAEFGANLWNGLYFEFKADGNALVGAPAAVDLNEISAPPEDLTVPPYSEDLRHEMPADARWIRQLVIE